MILLNFKNVEDLILLNTEIRNKLIDLRHIFDQWLLSYRIPALNSLRKKSIIDLISSLKDEHLLVLEKHFEDSVQIQKINRNIVNNLEFNLDDCDIISRLFEIDNFQDFAIFRDASRMYISFWK